MNTQCISAANQADRVQLRMLGTSLKKVFAVREDNSFDDLIRKLDQRTQ